MVFATNWGVAIAFDQKGRNARKWAAYRQKHLPQQRGLTGHALERAVMTIAQRFPGNVIREATA